MGVRCLELDDAELARAAALGDREAFGELFERHFDPVFRFCRAQIFSSALAEDIASETFVRALARIADFHTAPGTGGFAGWLYTIARNIVRDHWKSKRARMEVLVDEDQDGGAVQRGPEDLALRSTDVDVVRRCVELLTPDQKECLVLRFFSDLSIEQTAQAMDRTTNSVKQLQFRAVRALAARYADEMGG